MDKVMDRNRTCAKISKIIMQDEETLNLFEFMLRLISIKHDREINDHKHVTMIEIETIDDNVNTINKEKVKRKDL